MFLGLYRRKVGSKSVGVGLLLVILASIAYKMLCTKSPPLHWNPVDCFAAAPGILALGHPTFTDIRQYEPSLPQLQASRTRPSCVFWAQANMEPDWPFRRYVYFSGEAQGSGFNSVFQERLLNTHLAYLANRGYIFVDFTPRVHPPFPDTLPDGTRHMLHIPMNAFTSGPTGGGSLGPNSDPVVPRAAPVNLWNTVCPKEKVVEVHVPATVEQYNLTIATSGQERLGSWVTKLRNIQAPCVKVVGGKAFGWKEIGSDKVLSIWPSYGNSPALKEFAWSALITRAIARNYGLFSSVPPPSNIKPKLWLWTIDTGDASAPYPLSAFAPYRASSPPIQGLLGIHIRRGDYEQNCDRLAERGADYHAWNLFGRPDIRNTMKYPQLTDYLSIPDGVPRREAVLAHCLPTPTQILHRVRQVRAASMSGDTFPPQSLRAVYIATNGEPEWVRGVAELLKGDGWEIVRSSLDVKLAKDECAVAQAVDSAVLMSAETFIGVGFSSLSSNVVQLRLAGGRHPGTIRFW